jgi:hypothetical protein
MTVHLGQIGFSQRPQRRRVLTVLWRAQNQTPGSPSTLTSSHGEAVDVVISIGFQTKKWLLGGKKAVSFLVRLRRVSISCA